MLRLFSVLIFLTLAAICIWLAVANRDLVTLSLSPVDISLDMPLFFVGLIGVAIGIVAVLPTATVRAFLLRRKLAKANKEIARLQAEKDALTNECDGLKAQVRPEDERFANAQRVQSGPQGSVTGPTDQTVLPS
ncbi:MAG: LapA family protein [Pseudomonadota bacterium]